MRENEADTGGVVDEPNEARQTAAPSPEDELTNYRLVIEGQQRLFNIMMEARASSNRRLMTSIGTAVGLLIFLALARPAVLSSLQAGLLFLAAGLGGGVIALAADSLKTSFKAAGTTDWNEIHRDYIVVDTSKCLMQILSNALAANESLEKAMNKKAGAADMITRLLIGQALLTVGYWLSVTLS